MVKIIFVFALFLSSSAFASGILENLSTLSSGIQCQSFSSERVDQSLRRMAEKPLRSQNTDPAEKAKDDFFELLAQKSIPQLSCSADIAGAIASGQSHYFQDAVTKFSSIASLVKLRHELYTKNSLLLCPGNPKHPVSLNSLSPNQKNACSDIFKISEAIDGITATIPLSGMPEILNLITDLTEDQNAETSAQIESLVRAAFHKTQQELSSEKEAIEKNTQAPRGGAGLSRDFRIGLFKSTPLITEMIKRDQTLKPLVCKVNTEYGAGADALGRYVLGASLVANIAGGLYSRAAFKTAQVALDSMDAVRAVNLSLDTLRAVQYASLTLNGTIAVREIQKNCMSPTLYSSQSSCEATPNFETIKQSNCVLASLISSISLGSQFLSIRNQIRTLQTLTSDAALSALPTIVLENATLAGCEGNAQATLKALEAAGEDLSQTEVVVASKFGIEPSASSVKRLYSYHVFVLHKGMIYDPISFGKNVSVNPQSMQSFFSAMPFDAGSRLQVVPASQYIGQDANALSTFSSHAASQLQQDTNASLTSDWLKKQGIEAKIFVSGSRPF